MATRSRLGKWIAAMRRVRACVAATAWYGLRMALPEEMTRRVPAWKDVEHPVIGMVHLPALPGSPGFEPVRGTPLHTATDHALRDAQALADGGADGVMIENFGDVPFFKGRAPAETVAAMTAVAQRVRDAVNVPVGINVLRNDARSALAVAKTVGASFVRVNVLVGAYVTDQGVIEGQAADVMRYRAALGADDVLVLADVRVKHAAPLADRPIEEETEELVQRAGADGVIVSGAGTGKPTDMDRVAAVKRAAGDTPVFVGSGATVETAAGLLRHADGLIVGSSLKVGGVLEAPVDAGRVRALVEAVRAL